jgi:hypothetical protein
MNWTLFKRKSRHDQWIHEKIFSIFISFSVIREMQIKTTLILYFTPVRIAMNKIKTTTKILVRMRVGNPHGGTLIHY